MFFGGCREMFNMKLSLFYFILLHDTKTLRWTSFVDMPSAK